MEDNRSLKNEYEKIYSEKTDKRSLQSDKNALKLAKFIKRNVDKISKHSSKIFLDIGCGKGIITNAFNRLGWEATGFDFSQQAISKAKEMYPNCIFLEQDAYNPKFSSQFDVILMRGFSGANTHKLEDVAKLVRNYEQYLTENGIFIFAFNSNFSGIEKESETTVNWSKNEINEFVKLSGLKKSCFLFYPNSIIYQIYKNLFKVKDYYYIFLQRVEK